MRDGRRPLLALGLVALLASAPAAPAVQRFPQPDFKSGYRMPVYTPPVPDRPAWREWANAAALSGALGAAAWLALRRRSRRGVWMLTVLCLVWFGLVRKGCVCPVGSIQNIAVALADPYQRVPWTVASIFLMPLAAALLWGRVFCAGVCPLGAIQDLVVIRPVRLPRWLSRPLALLAPTYLGRSRGAGRRGGGLLDLSLRSVRRPLPPTRPRRHDRDRPGHAGDRRVCGAALLPVPLSLWRPVVVVFAPFVAAPDDHAGRVRSLPALRDGLPLRCDTRADAAAGRPPPRASRPSLGVDHRARLDRRRCDVRPMARHGPRAPAPSRRRVGG